MKKDIVPIVFLSGLALGVVALFVLMHFSMKPRPCGAMDYNKNIVPGYSAAGRYTTYCFECKDLEDPSSTRTNEDNEDELRVCPKETLHRYNENAKRLNAELIEKGYEPRYKVYEER
jgi:hypothetical protein